MNYSKVVIVASIFIFVLFLPAISQVTFTKNTTSPVVTGGGATFGSSWVDYDGDGDLDLFAVNFNNQNNNLYRNDGGGNFTLMTSVLVGSIVSDAGNSFSCSWGDYDNDGDLDVYIANASPTVTNENDFLYTNDGDGTFTRVTTGSVVTSGGFTTGGSWVDYDNDGFLDLFAVNNNQVNFLFHNNGNGTFTRITTGNALIQQSSRHHGCSWSDYDNDGDMDVFVACNIGTVNRMYRNDGGGVFTRITTGEIVTDVGSAQGASWGDYDNDGDMDLFVPNRSGQDNNLYRNNGDGTFSKMTSAEVGSIVNDGGDSFGSGWSDVDNDGDIDLYVANWSGENDFLYFNNNDGTFTRDLVGDIVNDGGESQAVSWGDYDGDGFEDLFVGNGYFANENDFLYHNDGNSNHWLTIRCTGTTSNRSAIGTKVLIKATINGNSRWQVREIAEQTGAFGHNSLYAHFGLGDAVTVDSVVLLWPSGLKEYYANLPANQFVSLTEGEGQTITLLSALPGDQSVLLRWTASTDVHFWKYRIYMDTVSHPTAIHDSMLIVTDTSLVITGLTNDITYYFRISEVTQDTGESAYSNELSATPSVNIQRGVSVDERWNLVSVPVQVQDFSKNTIFPAATTSAFSYLQNGSYAQHGVLELRKGYWLKFDSSQTFSLQGLALYTDTFTVHSGWNLIGSISNPVSVLDIISDPPGIITSNFFGYAKSYIMTDSIRPGEGYWVHSSADGKFILSNNSAGGKSNRIHILNTSLMPPPPPGEARQMIGLPAGPLLVQSYPNPFNPSATIEYVLEHESSVTLQIFNIIGEAVITLVDKVEHTGLKKVIWNGEDRNGKLVSGGVYYYRITAGILTQTGKMIYLK